MTATNVALVGFTLANGIAPYYSASSTARYGGGSYGGSLVDCVVTNCNATSGGGCYYSRVSNCRIVGNTASTGGGATSSTIDRSLICGNRAAINGGGIASGQISDSIIAENVAERMGGGTYSVSAIYNCTIAANMASRGGGIYYSIPRAYNSIIWGNTLLDGVTTDNWAGREEYGYFYYCCTMPLPSEGAGLGTSIDVDPYLCHFPDGSYRIPVGSQCIDAGSNSYMKRYYYQSGLISSEMIADLAIA